MIDTSVADALRESSPQYSLLIACRQLREWIDLPDADCARRVRSVLTNERVARSLVQAKSLVWGRLAREFAAPSSDWMTALGALDARTASGTSTATDQEYVGRVLTLLAINALVVESYPAAMRATAHDPQLEEIVARVPALEAAIHGCDVYAVSTESIAALQSAIDVFVRIADTWTPPIHANHAWWLGMAHYTLGRAALEIGDPVLARDAFERGVADYERAREWANADDLRLRVLAIDRGARGDVDAAMQEAITALATQQDPLRRCASLAALATAAKQAGDQYEFARVASRLAHELVLAGYADPDLDARHAMREWAVTGVETLRDDDLLKRVSDVAQQWAVVMGARATDRNEDGTLRDADRSARAERCLTEIAASMSVMLDEAAMVNAEIGAELAEWYDPDSPQSVGAVAEPKQQTDGDPSTRVAARASEGAAISSALYAIRLACNERPSDLQLIELDALLTRARTMESRIHEVQVWLERAYVELALNRYADVSASTREALRVLARGQSASLSAFPLQHERELYLTARQYEARALVGLRQHEEILGHCTIVIAEIEQQRTRVTAPYQQSAFLASRAEFYEYCAAAAYKLGRHDLLLETTERLKASSAWKLGRLALDELPEELAREIATLDARYVEVNRLLADAHVHGVARDELLERRRNIATSRAIARGKARTEAPPAPTIASVQQALAADEAALSYFWLADDVLLVIAISHDRFHAETIELRDDARSCLQRWTQWVGVKSGTDDATMAAELDTLIDALTPTLFPPSIRDFVRGKTRLVVSPHRVLHLFPFHAIRLIDQTERPWLLQHSAVRYAPNLTSLLLEWRGNREGPVLAIGINDFRDAELPRLENAVLEAQQVASAHGSAGRAATSVMRSEFASMPLSTYRCIHLATHGTSVLTGDAHNDPLNCGIAFTDGLLDGSQIAALDLRAELVVLASCYSGQRAIGGRGLSKLPGDDILGLQAVMFEAGVGTLLGALWPVDDESARAILGEFHRHYATGESPDRALQSALNTYLDNPFRRHDRFAWAPFFLTSVRNPTKQPIFITA